jgi:ATP-dependent DNA ligase
VLPECRSGCLGMETAPAAPKPQSWGLFFDIARMASRLALSRPVAYLSRMRKPAFAPCIPTHGTKVPDRPEWFHEIKHDGYRLIRSAGGGQTLEPL